VIDPGSGVDPNADGGKESSFQAADSAVGRTVPLGLGVPLGQMDPLLGLAVIAGAFAVVDTRRGVNPDVGACRSDLGMEIGSGEMKEEQESGNH
jgi:hypothetical protein